MKFRNGWINDLFGLEAYLAISSYTSILAGKRGVLVYIEIEFNIEYRIEMVFKWFIIKI
jgi:hypothetical protein